MELIERSMMEQLDSFKNNRNIKYEFNPKVIIEKVDNGYLILNMETNMFFETNEIGKNIINLLKENDSFSSILDKLQEYKNFSKSEFYNFAEELIEKKILILDA